MRRERARVLTILSLKAGVSPKYLARNGSNLTAFLSSAVDNGSPIAGATDARESPAIINREMREADTWLSTSPLSPVKYSASIWICASDGEFEPMSSPDITPIHSSD